jgi:hypothetical protein
MEQCIRDSHKIPVTALNNVDRMEEEVEKLELRNKEGHHREQMHDAVALIGEQEELIKRQAEEIGRQKNNWRHIMAGSTHDDGQASA